MTIWENHSNVHKVAVSFFENWSWKHRKRRQGNGIENNSNKMCFKSQTVRYFSLTHVVYIEERRKSRSVECKNVFCLNAPQYWLSSEMKANSSQRSYAVKTHQDLMPERLKKSVRNQEWPGTDRTTWWKQRESSPLKMSKKYKWNVKGEITAFFILLNVHFILPAESFSTTTGKCNWHWAGFKLHPSNKALDIPCKIIGFKCCEILRMQILPREFIYCNGPQ